MAEVALSIFTAIVIAAISSWITVQLSLRKFRAERWWERKAEAYSKIIEARIKMWGQACNIELAKASGSGLGYWDLVSSIKKLAFLSLECGIRIVE